MRAKHTRLAGEPLDHSGKLPLTPIAAQGPTGVVHRTCVNPPATFPGNLPEWSRGSPAKRVCYARTGSNPVVVAHPILLGSTCGLVGHDARFTRERSRVRITARVRTHFCSNTTKIRLDTNCSLMFGFCFEGALTGYKHCEIA